MATLRTLARTLARGTRDRYRRRSADQGRKRPARQFQLESTRMSPALNAHARLLLILAKLLGGVLVAVLAVPGARAGAPVPTSVYQPIEPTMADQTVVLTGKDLRLEDVVRVARFGAKVRLSPEARRRSEDAYGLLLEAAADLGCGMAFVPQLTQGEDHLGDPFDRIAPVAHGPFLW